MSNHLSPASASEHSSYAASSSHLGASPAPSHHSTATSFSSSSPSPSAKLNGSSSSDAADFEAPAKPITCRWDDCGKIFYDPEVVYKHLCDDHVGRKSTNNLCLTCKWEGCDVSCAKRDHITSHIRVHTPLKPHNCDVCGKTFKRPQDLKKHERIHTEQHQQQRQHKAAQNAAARAYSISEHAASFGTYPYPPIHAANGYLGYPALPAQQGLYPSASAYPSAYPSLPTSDYGRDHYAHSTSSASLSPMSSRIDTPQGSSPAPNHHGQDGGSYMHLASGLDPRSKVTTDPTSYTYLAHGATTSHNLAGSKRGHEHVEDFFGDLRRKKMAPAYDSHMAERLNQTFGVNGIDDISLNAILSTFDPSAAYGQAPMNPAVKMENASAPRLQVKQEPTDLAQLNAFLLQLGASAASTLGSHSHSFSSSSGSSAGSSFSSQGNNADFDLSSLSQYGLTNIPGFDESLLANGQRSIAQLPSRAQGHHGHMHYPDTSSYSNGTHQMHQPSFDNVRVSRGPAIVPQLAPLDAGGHSYRRVEALTRAAPTETETIRHDDHRMPIKVEEEDDAMEEDELDDDASQVSSRFRSVSPAASSESGWSEAGRRGSSSPSHGLYPRVSPTEASRRLPPIRSNSTASTSASISSLLDSDRRLASRRDSTPFEGSSRHSAPAASPTPSSSSSSSNSLYPSLVDRVSQMQGLGRPLGRSPSASPSEESTEAMRREHVRLIRDLLIAINFPDKARAKLQEHDRVRLPPILTGSLPRRRPTEDGEVTPSAETKDVLTVDGEASDRNSTPTPPGRPTLPTLSQLLNDLPERRSRPMAEREMECDV
ncbi:probable Transcription factor pacC [Ustilago trichophora]|uniref:Probable Transcription factor pacC n=1 Tax=Ustilago trichophora TaxID=86804 RepID=A0A5C3EG03_9BASI|nr:probable Transcription factor pacC [Ustilago trichophora]